MKIMNKELNEIITDSSIKEDTKRNIILLNLIKKHLS